MVGLTLLRAHAGGLGSINYSQLQSLQYAYLFASGAVAITAMVTARHLRLVYSADCGRLPAHHPGCP